MGVPKLFRWLCERYPCLNVVVQTHQIPVFDNLYLDMNGIIHLCSHPNDDDVHFRISEEKIFADIFYYVEALFAMIKPTKTFFMAIDGVAPRAKMNQQRSRRFRSSQQSEQLEKEACKRGEILPKEARFDSNCITPGTEFMSRLYKQLQYFVSSKVSKDPLWQKVCVILSGDATPGEGEHKIMDFIRSERSKKNYDPNTRHCLYGLDADLIMLGLVCHEPNFALLREEVRFGGRKQAAKTVSPDKTTFHLLHLSLLREYLDCEFSSLKAELGSEYDVECIVDDWVMICFLLGNDFIPNLPNLHINEGGLSELTHIYKKHRPALGGYLNDSGCLNMSVFEEFMKCLSSVEQRNFQAETIQLVDSECVDAKYSVAINQFKHDYYTEKFGFDRVNEQVLMQVSQNYVQAIQWNLLYYYNGCQSWDWFYPYHYAPFISDIHSFDHTNFVFHLGQPFLPFQQLLSVLPAASRELLPKCLQGLMVNETSPIIDFYPKDFQLDMNGKKQAWEAVVLIPFIDAQRLVQAMEPLMKGLSAAEKARNTQRPMLMYSFTQEELGPYPAPAYFPIIARNHAKCIEVDREEWLVPIAQLRKGLLSNASGSLYSPGFPSLRHLPFHFGLKKIGVRVFEQECRGESMILQLQVTEGAPDMLAKATSELLDKVVWVSWPHLVEAKVVAVQDQKDIACSNTFNAGTISSCYPSQGDFSKLADVIKSKYLSRLGIEVNSISVIVHACVVSGTKLDYGPGGKVSVQKVWANEPQAFAYQAIVENLRVRNVETLSPLCTLEHIFPVGSTCFYLGSPHRGAMCKVLNIEPMAKNPIKVSLTIPRPVQLMLDHTNKHEAYYTTNILARKLRVPVHLVSRLTGTVLVCLGPQTAHSDYGNKMNIGLRLRNMKERSEVKGFSRMGYNNRFLYSSKTLSILMEYIDRYPQVFEHLSTMEGVKDVHYSELFGEDGERIVNELVRWIKQLPCSQSELKQPFGQITISEECAAQVMEIVSKKCPSQSIVLSTKPDLLYKPDLWHDNPLPDLNATFMLLDRVVNVRHGMAVPVGLTGTVTSLVPVAHNSEDQVDDNQMLEVLFDSPFVGALETYSSYKSSYRMPSSALINLSQDTRSDRPSYTRPEPQWQRQQQQQQQQHKQQQQRQQQQQRYEEDYSSMQLAVPPEPSCLPVPIDWLPEDAVTKAPVAPSPMELWATLRKPPATSCVASTLSAASSDRPKAYSLLKRPDPPVCHSASEADLLSAHLKAMLNIGTSQLAEEVDQAKKPAALHSPFVPHQVAVRQKSSNVSRNRQPADGHRGPSRAYYNGNLYPKHNAPLTDWRNPPVVGAANERDESAARNQHFHKYKSSTRTLAANLKEKPGK